MLRAIILCAMALSLSACAGGLSLPELTKHLNDRGCYTSGGLAGSSVGPGVTASGHLEWECGNKESGQQTPAKPPDAAILPPQ